MFDETITIYNKYIETVNNTQVEKWKRTVLKGVQVRRKNERIVGSNGTVNYAHVISITIPYRKGYVPEKQFAGKGFTFGLHNEDIVVLGVCKKEVSNNLTITQLRKSEPDAWTIKGLADNTGHDLLKHWRLSCV